MLVNADANLKKKKIYSKLTFYSSGRVADEREPAGVGKHPVGEPGCHTAPHLRAGLFGARDHRGLLRQGEALALPGRQARYPPRAQPEGPRQPGSVWRRGGEGTYHKRVTRRRILIVSFLCLQLLHSLDEDDRSVPESPILPKDKEANDVRRDSLAPQASPMRHSSLPAVTAALPVSASPNTNSKFVSIAGPNGQLKNSPVKVGHVNWELIAFGVRKVNNIYAVGLVLFFTVFVRFASYRVILGNLL